MAAEEGNAPVVSALLQNNADCDAVDCDSDNALHIAVREGNLAVVRQIHSISRIFYISYCLYSIHFYFSTREASELFSQVVTTEFNFSWYSCNVNT